MFGQQGMGASEPSARVGIFTLAADSTDTNLQIFHAGSVTPASANKIDLGSNFPKTNGTYVRFTLTCPGNGADITYRVRRLDTSVPDATGTPVINVPPDTMQLLARFEHSPGITPVTATLGYVQARAKVLALP
jgi:hypothetical protein